MHEYVLSKSVSYSKKYTEISETVRKIEIYKREMEPEKTQNDEVSSVCLENGYKEPTFSVK